LAQVAVFHSVFRDRNFTISHYKFLAMRYWSTVGLLFLGLLTADARDAPVGLRSAHGKHANHNQVPAADHVPTETLMEPEALMIAPPMQTSCPTLPTTTLAGWLTVLLCGIWGGGYVLLHHTTLGALPASDGPSGDGGRLPILDNAKFIVMLLVILQHTGVAFIDGDFRTDVFQFIQLHTRLFCFLSGVVARRPPNMKSLKALLFSLVVPHIFWVTIVQPLGFALRGDLLRGATVPDFMYARMTELFTGAGLEWFLFSLIWWRIIGWMLMPLMPAARMGVAITLSLIAGYPEETIITSIGHHILAYLPVFVLGQLFPLEEVLGRVRSGPVAACLGSSLLLGFFLLEGGEAGRPFMAQIPMYDWNSMPSCGAASDALFWVRGSFRTMLEMTKGLIFLIFVCPRGNSFITPYGQTSLYPYLLQGLMGQEVQLVQFVLFYFGKPPQLIGLIEVLANSFFINVVLGTWPCRKVFGILLEPTWLQDLLATPDDPAKEPLTKKAAPSIGNTFSKDAQLSSVPEIMKSA